MNTPSVETTEKLTKREKREQEAALRRMYRERYAAQREKDRARFKEIDALLKRAKELCFTDPDIDFDEE